MATDNRKTWLDLARSSEWSRDDSSEFEYLSLTDSGDFSLGYESMISDDLDLYEDGCVC